MPVEELSEEDEGSEVSPEETAWLSDVELSELAVEEDSSCASDDWLAPSEEETTDEDSLPPQERSPMARSETASRMVFLIGFPSAILGAPRWVFHR